MTSATPRQAFVSKVLVRAAALSACLLLAMAGPASAKDLGIDLKTLLEGLTQHAAAAGKPISVKKVGCRENPKPGDASKKIVSCSHLLGPGKVLITNADPSGPLLDINTQRWAAGADGPAVEMTTWLSAVLSGQPPANHAAGANDAVKKALADKTSSTDIAGYAFNMMDFGNNMVISVSPK